MAKESGDKLPSIYHPREVWKQLGGLGGFRAAAGVAASAAARIDEVTQRTTCEFCTTASFVFRLQLVRERAPELDPEIVRTFP